MGATLWFHEAHGDSSADTALKFIQSEFLAENYDLPALLAQHLIWAKESVASVESEGDHYGLLDMFREKVELLERLNNQPIPNSAETQIEIVRQIWADSGEGIGNILDVIGISQEREFLKAQELDQAEVTRLTGTDKPTLTEARNSVDIINEELRRGDCVCFPFYESDSISGWYFIGNTID